MYVRKLKTKPVEFDAISWDGSREASSNLVVWIKERIDSIADLDVKYVDQLAGTAPYFGPCLWIGTPLHTQVYTENWMVFNPETNQFYVYTAEEAEEKFDMSGTNESVSA